MEKQLTPNHLKLLNIVKYKKGNILSVVIILFSYSCFNEKVRDLPKVNKEVVRKDILTNYKDFFDEEYFKHRDTSMFFVQYLDGYCFVHIPYRINNTSEKASVIAIYHLKNNNWEYERTIPYYSSLQQLNSKKKLFLSDNEYCEGNGACNYYWEVSEFHKNEMSPILSYYGYNYEVYYGGLLVKGDLSSVIKAKGDTIKNLVKLSNFVFDDKGLKTYTLERKIGILTDLKKDALGDDSIVIKQSTFKQVIQYQNP